MSIDLCLQTLDVCLCFLFLYWDLFLSGYLHLQTLDIYVDDEFALTHPVFLYLPHFSIENYHHSAPR
jgi:hypothetical protein